MSADIFRWLANLDARIGRLEVGETIIPGAPGGAHSVLSLTHTDTLADTVVAGDVVIGNDTPKWARLAIAIPGAGQCNYLGVNNAETKPSWKGGISNPGAQAALLATNASGYFSVVRIGLGMYPPTECLDVAGNAYIHGGNLFLGPVGAGAGNTGHLEFRELVANGTDVVGFKAPDSIAADVIWTLPGVDGSAGQALVTSGAGVLSWAAPAPGAHNLLSVSHGDTLAAAVVAGDLFIGNDTPKWARLGITIPAAGTQNYLGVSNAETKPSWKSASSAPGAAAAVLASNASGYLQLVRLGLGVSPAAELHLSAGPIRFGSEFDLVDSVEAGVGIFDALAQGTKAMAMRIRPGAGTPGYGLIFGEMMSAFFEFHRDSTTADRLFIMAPTTAANGYYLTSYVFSGTPGPISFGFATGTASQTKTLILKSDGSCGFGISPTAVVHLKAGTAVAGTAPLKLTSGVALATIEDGALEYHSSHLFFSIGAVRYQLDQQTGVAAHDLLSASHSDTTAASAVRGDLVTGQGVAPLWTRLAKGLAYAVLTGDGTDTAWSTYLFSGTAGGKTTLAVTNTKTLTLTATDSYNLTIPATGTATLGTGTQYNLALWSGTNMVKALGALGSAGNLLRSAGAGADPAWTTTTYPATTTAYTLAVATATNVMGELAAGTTDKVLVGVTGAVPVWSTPTFPNASATTGKVIISDGTNWIASTPTFANTYAVSTILYASAANVVTGLATGNSGVLVTSGAGVPSIGTDIPTAVTIGTKYIYRADGTDVPVADGGTGVSTLALNGVLYGNGASAVGVTAIGAQYKILTVGATPFVPIFSGYLLDGTAGGKTILAVTNTKTLTLTATDSFNLTIPATGTAAVGAGTLTVSTINDVTVASHTHAITTSANPGAAASILASDASGYLQLVGLGIGVAAGAANRITIKDGGSVGQAAGPLLTFDDTNNYLEITGCSVGINNTAPAAKLEISGAGNELRLSHTDNTALYYVTFDALSDGSFLCMAVGDIIWTPNSAADDGYVVPYPVSMPNPNPRVHFGRDGREWHDGWFAGGLNLGTSTGAGDGEVKYSGDLISYKNATAYTGYIFVPLPTRLTSTSWDGDAKVAADNGILDLSALFGVPAGVKAVHVSLSFKDPTAGLYAYLGSASTNADTQYELGAYTQVANNYVSIAGVVPCDANGDVYFTCNTSVNSAYYLVVTGYFI